MWGGPREPREGLRWYCRCDRKPGARLGQGGDPQDGEWEWKQGLGEEPGQGQAAWTKVAVETGKGGQVRGLVQRQSCLDGQGTGCEM